MLGVRKAFLGKERIEMFNLALRVYGRPGFWLKACIEKGLEEAY